MSYLIERPHVEQVKMASMVLDMRPTVNGKFVFIGDEKFYIRGITYGPFRPDEKGCEYHHPALVERDFAQMANFGVNAVRTYTVPPNWLVDIAQKHGLRVMIGLPWEQHITFLDDKERVRSIEQRVREGVRAYAGHPAVLCFAIGNEIPSPIVRWHGRRAIERFIERLYYAAKSEDPDGLVTYVNYPTTEYLKLPFLDFACFNVYLEQQDRLEVYIARLHNVVEDQPLLLAEIGLDSLRNGEEMQAKMLDWQLRTSFSQGCAGAFVFAWTDEWHRGGENILDWNFGLTDRDRRPKPALTAVSEVFHETPFPANIDWPRISVVVCSHNGARTIRDCCEGLSNLNYSDYEVIVVDDGSDDGTGDIASESGFRVIRTANQGLSAARNTGINAATGEIIAFIDDDAYPDPDWLTYIAHTYDSTSFAGVGGPNYTPDEDSLFSKCIGAAPGGPVHVLLTDTIAEHIPGVNMTFRKSCLLEINGFDPQFRVAGDDVDICWQFQERGWELGFNPAAVVWHHRRDSLRAYWKQQTGYGKAEVLLEQKWSEKYNDVGHVTWSGRVYGNGAIEWLPWRRGRVYQGIWGTAPFQSIYQPAHAGLSALVLTPEWYLVLLFLGLLSSLSLAWKPLLFALPFFVLAAGLLFVQVGVNAGKSKYVATAVTQGEKIRRWSLLMPLYLIQPLSRLVGRFRGLLALPRHSDREKKRRAPMALLIPRSRLTSIWSEHWRSNVDWLQLVEEKLRAQRVAVRRGGNYDRWDLDVRTGRLSSTRLFMTIEEHGGDRQMIRFRLRPVFSIATGVLLIVLTLLSIGAGLDGLWGVAVGFGIAALLVGIRILAESSQTTSVVLDFCQLIAQQQIKESKKAPVQSVEIINAALTLSKDGPTDGNVTDASVEATNLGVLASTHKLMSLGDAIQPGAEQPK